MSYTLDQLTSAAEQLSKFVGEHNVYALHGNMGAGKTTLISAVCRQLGVANQVSSPTFSIIQEYTTGDGQPIYHIDLFRLNNEQEAVDAGVEEILFSGHQCFIEWAEKAPGILPDNALHVYITVIDESSRVLNVNVLA